MTSDKFRRLKFLAMQRGDLITEDFLLSFIEKNRELIESSDVEGLVKIMELEDPIFKDLVFGGKDIEGIEFDKFWLDKLRSFKL